MTLHLIKPTILHIRLHNLIIWRESLQTSIIQKLATQEDTNLYPLVILWSVWMPFIKQPMPSLVNRTRKLPNGGIAKPGSCYRESPQQHCPRTLDLSFPATSPSSSSAVFIVILQEVPKRNPISDLQLAVEEQMIWGLLKSISKPWGGHCSSPKWTGGMKKGGLSDARQMEGTGGEKLRKYCRASDNFIDERDKEMYGQEVMLRLKKQGRARPQSTQYKNSGVWPLPHGWLSPWRMLSFRET